MKRRCRIRKNFVGSNKFRINFKSRLHTEYGIVPIDFVCKKYMSDYEIYHYGCFNEDLRVKRVEKYKKHDPNNENQRFGYDYILDYNNLKTKKIGLNKREIY